MKEVYEITVPRIFKDVQEELDRRSRSPFFLDKNSGASPGNVGIEHIHTGIGYSLYSVVGEPVICEFLSGSPTEIPRVIIGGDTKRVKKILEELVGVSLDTFKIDEPLE
jgi:hypothetical protein